MSERVQTPVTGITTMSAYEEGSAYSLVNLRPKNGALHPVPPRKIVQELSREYNIIFIHQNNDYQNWIGVVVSDTNSAVYWDVRNQQPSVIASISGKVNSVQQIGNTLSLITEDNVYYLFFNNNKYTFLGEVPQVPVINLKTSDQMSYAELYFANEYGAGTIGDKDTFIEATKGLVNKAMSNITEEYGLQLFDACFIRYAFRLYDGTLTKHSPPILVMPIRAIVGKEDEGNNDSIKSIGYRTNTDTGKLVDESRVRVYGYRIYMDYDFTRLGNDSYTKWEDIISSVDIFMSAPLGISNIENIRSDMPFPVSEVVWKEFNLIKSISPDNLKTVANTSTFYFIKSIELGKYVSSFEPEILPTTDSEISKMENLIYQEVMSDDQFSNHKYGAATSYAYNNRLHLANLKTTFFNGFNPDYFLWYNTASVDPEGNPIHAHYNGYDYADAPGEKYNNLLIEVEINTGVSKEKVYQYLKNSSLGYPTPIYKLFMSAFLSYPDPRAKRITIYRYSNYAWYKVFSAPLEAHNLLNIAYYLNDGLKPIIENIQNPQQVNLPDTTKTISISEPNKIKVSALSNPLAFPNTTVYQVGTGTILAMATNAMNVSDRNYGQYPLYVFTTRGVWTLNVGSGEVVYSTIEAPTYTEAPTTGIVGETPYGVVFTTQRGLMIINGQSVEFISPQIEQKPLVLNIEMNSHCDGVVFYPEQKKFSELLKDLSGLIYNPYENELIVNVAGSELNYVLNFDSSSFYQSTEKISLAVGNALPELYVSEGKKLKDYAQFENPLTHIAFILRPLQYSTPGIKRMERMILNALFYDVTNPAPDKFSLVMAHYSNDGINFLAAKGFPVNEGNRRDFDMGLFSRTKASRFTYTFAGVIDEKSQIYFIDSILDKEYNNTKLR